MPQPKKELYNNLVQQGLFTGSYEKFSSAFGSDEGMQALHSSLASAGKTSMGLDDFSNTFFDEAPQDTYALQAIEAMRNPQPEQPAELQVGEFEASLGPDASPFDHMMAQYKDNNNRFIVEGEEQLTPGSKILAGASHVVGTSARFLSDFIDDYMGAIPDDKLEQINKISDPEAREKALRDARLATGQSTMGALSQGLSNLSSAAHVAGQLFSPEYTESKSMTELAKDGDFGGFITKGINETAQIMTEMAMASAIVPGSGLTGSLAKASGSKVAMNIAGRAGGAAEFMGLLTYQDSYDENLNAGMGQSWANFSNAAIKGVAEYGGELVSFKLLDNAMSDAIVKGYGKEMAGNLAKGIVASIGQEAISEGATQVAQDLADMMLKPEGQRPSWSDMVDHTVEAMILGGFVGGGMTSVHALPNALQKTIADRSLTQAEKATAVGLVNEINLINFERQKELNNGATHDSEVITDLDNRIEQAQEKLRDITTISYERMSDMSQDELTSLVRAGRDVRFAKAQIENLNKQRDAFEISYGEHEELMKGAVAALDDAQQNESQIVNKVVETNEQRQRVRKIMGYENLPNKGKPVELMSEKDITSFFEQFEQAMEESMTDEGAEEIVIEAEEGDIQQQEFTQEDIDKMDVFEEEGIVLGVAPENATSPEAAATSAATAAGIEVTSDPVVETTEEGVTMVKIGTPRGEKVLTINKSEDGTIESVETTVPKARGPKQVKIEEPATKGRVLKTGGHKGLNNLKSAIEEYQKSFGKNTGVYAIEEVPGGYKATIADRQMGIEFDVIAEDSGMIDILYHGDDGKPRVGSISGSQALGNAIASVSDLHIKSKTARDMDNFSGRYQARFGVKSSIVDGVDMGVNGKTVVENENKADDDAYDVVEVIANQLESGATGGTVGINGKLKTPKKGTVIATVASVNVSREYFDGNRARATGELRDLIHEKAALSLGNKNVTFGFWVMENGDVAIDFNVILPESMKDQALAFAKFNNQEAIYYKDKKGKEHFLPTGNNEAITSQGSKLENSNDVAAAIAILKLGKDFNWSRNLANRVKDIRTTLTPDQKLSNFIKTFKSLFPDIDVQVFDTTEEALKAEPQWTVGAAGQVTGLTFKYRSPEGLSERGYPYSVIIVKDANGGDPIQVASHEIWHTILGVAFNKNEKLLKQFRDMISNSLVTSGATGFDNYINKFADQPHYRDRGEGMSHEEYIVEFASWMGQGLAPNAENLTPFQQKIFDAMFRATEKMGNYLMGPGFIPPSEVNASNVIQFIAGVNDMMMKGESLESLHEGKNDMSGAIILENGDGESNVDLESLSNSEISNELLSMNNSFNAFDPDVEVGFEKPFSKGKVKAVPFMADRMATGTYTGLDPNSGIEIPMQGGIGCPHMKGYFGKIGWFVEGGSIATALKKGLMRLHDEGLPAYGIPMFMGPNAHMSNQTFAQAFMAECNWLIQSGKKTEAEIIDAINQAIANNVLGSKSLESKWGVDKETGTIKDKSSNKPYRTWAIDTTPIDMYVEVDGKKLAVAFATFEPKKVSSLDEWFNIMTTSFDSRKAFFGGLYGGDKVKNPGANARKLGLPDVGKMVEMMTDPRSKGLPNGTAVNIIEFKPIKQKDGSMEMVFTPEELGVDPHMSYALGMSGEAKGYLKKPIHIQQFEETDEEGREWKLKNWGGGYTQAQATSNATRRATMKMPLISVKTNKPLKMDKAAQATKKLAEVMGNGEVSDAASAVIYNYFKKVMSGARTSTNNTKDFVAMINNLIGEVVIRDPQIQLTPQDVNEILSRASRVAPNGVKSIVAFEKYLNRRFARASKRVQKEAAIALREAAKEKRDLIKTKDEIIKSLKLRTKQGKISLAQLNAIVKRMNRVDFNNPMSIEAFVDYVSKVAAHAEYAQKISEARVLQAKIRKAKRKSDMQASTRGVASAFAKLDPRRAQDIDEYLEHARIIESAMTSNKFVGYNEAGEAIVTVKDTFSHETINKYVEMEAAEQEELRRQDFMARYAEMMADGTIDETMTLDQMQAIVSELDLERKEEVDAAKEAAVNKYLDKMLEYQKNRIDEAMLYGIDPETGSLFTMTKDQEKLIKKLLDNKEMIGSLTTKEKYKMLESLDNFVQNGVTDGIRAIIAGAQGRLNGKNFNKKAQPLGMALLKSGKGRGWASAFETWTSSLPITGSRMFNGVKEWAEVSRQMGLAQFIEGAIAAEMETNKILKEYENLFITEGFNTSANIVERAVIANLMRNVMSSNENQDAEFKRRIGLIKGSIETAARSSDVVVKTQAELAQAALSKLLGEVQNYQEFIGHVEALSESDETLKKNVEAVKFWQEKWSSTYDRADAISREVYDTILEQDVAYTPDRMIKVKGQPEDIDFDSGFFNEGFVPTERAGTLMKATRPAKLPNGRMLSFNFDSNMVSAMETALVDINTAESTRQVKEFLNSDGWNNSFDNIDDLTMMTDKVINYMKRAKGVKAHRGNPMAQDGWFNVLNRVIKATQGMLLTSLPQPVKQILPVMMNTWANGNSKFKTIMPGSSADVWLSEQPYAINVRGGAARSEMGTIRGALRTEAETVIGKGFSKFEDYVEWRLKWLVENPDVWVARSSWITYYMDFIKRKQKADPDADPETFDWESHKVDKQAAEYAQAMVDRQQNVSDAKMSGEFYQMSGVGGMLRRTIMPFSTFIMNQKRRVGADVNILTSSTASLEEKATALQSLSGAIMEISTFVFIRSLVGASMSYLAALAMGDDEEERDKVFLEKMGKAHTDILGTIPVELGPLPPVLDEISTEGINWLGKKMGSERDILYASSDKKMMDYLFPGGVAAYERVKSVYDMNRTAVTGKFEKQNPVTKEWENRYLQPEDRAAMDRAAWLSWIALGTTEDPQRIAQKIQRIAQKNSMTENEYMRFMAETQGGTYEQEYIDYKLEKKKKAQEKKIKEAREKGLL